MFVTTTPRSSSLFASLLFFKCLSQLSLLGSICALCVVAEQTGPPLYGVLCPDWMNEAGIPKHVFLLSRKKDGLLTKHSINGITVEIQSYLTHIMLTATLTALWGQIFKHSCSIWRHNSGKSLIYNLGFI